MNVYEAVLQWGYDSIDEGRSHQEFEEFLRDNRFYLPEPRRSALFTELFVPLDRNESESGLALDEGELFQLKVEAALRHLEHVEMLEARRGKLLVRMVAILLVLAVLVGGVQLMF